MTRCPRVSPLSLRVSSIRSARLSYVLYAVCTVSVLPRSLGLASGAKTGADCSCSNVACLSAVSLDCTKANIETATAPKLRTAPITSVGLVSRHQPRNRCHSDSGGDCPSLVSACSESPGSVVGKTSRPVGCAGVRPARGGGDRLAGVPPDAHTATLGQGVYRDQARVACTRADSARAEAMQERCSGVAPPPLTPTQTVGRATRGSGAPTPTGSASPLGYWSSPASVDTGRLGGLPSF
jgi:hypothetical protein